MSYAEDMAVPSNKASGFICGRQVKLLYWVLFAIVFAVCGTFPALGQTSPPTTGLKLWLAADTGVTIDGSGGVSAWSDQSGNGSNATQATSGNRPTVTANVLNSKPVVHFNGSAMQYLSLPNLLNGASAAEALVVLRASAASGNNSGLWYFGTSGASTWYPIASGLMYDSFASSTYQIEGAPSADITQFHIYDAASQANLWRSWFDGVPFYKGTSNTVAFTSTPLLGQNSGYGFFGDIAEILVYDHVLTDADRLAASIYLAQKYSFIAAPAAPTILTTERISSTQAVISWANATLANSATDYIIERQDGGMGAYVPVATIANGASMIDSGLTPGLSYSYRVYAQNWAGASGYSAAMSLAGAGTGAGEFPVAGMQLWLSADYALLSPLSIWQDLSGNVNDGQQTTYVARPTVTLNALNGKPVIHFNGSAMQYLSLPNLLNGASAAEALVVLRASAASGNNSGLWYFGTSGASTWYPIASGLTYDSFASNTYRIGGAPSADITQFHIYDAASQANLWRSWFDGVPFYKGTSNTVAFTSTPLLGQNSGYGFFGDIAEILIYNRVLTDSERYSIGAYLSLKYGLASAPAMPTNLVVTPQSPTENVISWNGPAGNGLVRYIVERATSSGGPYTQLAVVTGVGNYMDTTAVAGQQYYYRITAQNAGGASAATADVGVTTMQDGTNLPVTGLRLWLMADGTWESPLGYWKDYSGSGNDAWQNTYGNRPTVVNSSMNGKPVVHFSGSQFFALPDVMNGATSGDIFVVTKSALAGNIMMQFANNPYTYGAHYPWTDGRIYDDFGSTVQNPFGTPALPILNTPTIYNASAQPGSLVLRINGIEQSRTFANTVSFTATPMLGTRLFKDYFYNGDIAEVMLYDHVLTDAERTNVLNYLGGKYGFVAAPSAPANFNAVPLSPNQVSLTWGFSPSSFTTQFLIQRKTDIGGAYSTVATVSDSGSYIDTTAVAGTRYFYKINEKNCTGTSGSSTEVEVDTPLVGTSLPMAGIRLWIKADASGNSTLCDWPDLSGLKNNPLQTLAGSRPTLLANALNGRPVVHFSGSGQYLNLPNVMNGATAGEIYVVTRAQSDTSTTGHMLMQWGANPYTYGTHYPWTDGRIYDDFGSSAQQVIGDVGQSLDQAHIYNVSAQAGQFVVRINGLEQYRNDTNTVSFTATPKLGSRLFTDYFYAGDIAEVIVYDHVLGEDERKAVEFYLGGKYGVVATLPAPTSLFATAFAPSQVGLSWNEAPGNCSVTYSIERKTGSGAYALLGAVDDTASFFDTTTQGGLTYTYRVRAFNYGGFSSYSNEFTVATPFVGSNVPLAGMRLWLKADAGVNDPVSSWQDQSGLDNSARQPTTANRPSLIANALNGRPVVHFNGSGQYLNLPDVMNGAAAGEIFVVAKATQALPTASSELMQFGSNPYTYGTIYPHTDGQVIDDWGSTTQHIMGPVSETLTDANLYNVSSQAGLWVARFNGVEHYSTTTNTASFAAAPVLGTRLLKDLTYAGDIAEIIVYDHVLSDTERRRVAYYLNCKYLIPSMDADGDGLTNAEELALGTDPFNWDTNGDGLSDRVDILLGYDPKNMDLDGDGLTNAVEIAMGLNPFWPDSDGDGVPDALDAFPFDPTRWQLPVIPGDSTQPVITLFEPIGAVPIP